MAEFQEDYHACKGCGARNYDGNSVCPLCGTENEHYVSEDDGETFGDYEGIGVDWDEDEDRGSCRRCGSNLLEDETEICDGCDYSLGGEG